MRKRYDDGFEERPDRIFITKRNISFLWGGVVVIVILLISSQLAERLRDAFAIVEPPTATVVSSQTIALSVQPLGELTTVRVELAKANIEVITQYGVANVCRIGATHVAQGAIEAGIDLASVQSGDIVYDEESDQYQITVPPAQLTGCSLDPMATQQYASFGATLACPMDFDELRRLASYQALIDFRDDALEAGILERAQNEANLVLTGFVTTLTDKNVQILFEAPENPVLPASCMPQPPSTWRFDETSGIWVR